LVYKWLGCFAQLIALNFVLNRHCFQPLPLLSTALLNCFQRKTEAAIAAHKEKAAKRQEAKDQQQQQGWFDLKVNTSVYVTGLPGDTTPEEVAGVFSKCGILKLGADGQPRIKLYR
jgi:hypothetical protein